MRFFLLSILMLTITVPVEVFATGKDSLDLALSSEVINNSEELGDTATMIIEPIIWDDFDGITNCELHELVTTDTSFKFYTWWNNDMCFTNANNLRNMKDSIWICLTDSIHSKYATPVPGVLTSGFKYRGSRMHKGVDLDLNIGDTVVSAFDGVVRYAKYNSHGYGNLVIVRHFNGLETYYAHLNKINVQPNQIVNAGDLLGQGGKTGRAYGPHLHFEVRFYDNALNPEEVFDFDKGVIQDCNLTIKSDMFYYKKLSYQDFRKPQPGKTYNSRGTNASANGYYYVQSGDNLWAISRRYGTTVDNLCRLNGISRDATLQIGQKLRIR